MTIGIFTANYVKCMYACNYYVSIHPPYKASNGNRIGRDRSDALISADTEPISITGSLLFGVVYKPCNLVLVYMYDQFLSPTPSSTEYPGTISGRRRRVSLS